MGAFTGIKWPGAIIPYTISPNFTEIQKLNTAITNIEAVTNLRFAKRQPLQPNYVAVHNHSAQCNSYIGRIGGEQIINCAPFGFGVGSLIHEICHACGMIHEHQRNDRNTYVRIINANILAGEIGNFNIETNSRNRFDYDPNSIMHYGPNAFNNGTVPTIEALSPPLPQGVILGGNNVLTKIDIAAINTEYPNLGVVRRSNSPDGAGRIRDLSIVRFMGSSDRFITAVRTGRGTLMLIEWRINARGSVQRISDSAAAAGAATHIDIARVPNENRFVTACRAGNGKLMLISWNSALGRMGDSGNAAGAATLNRIIAITDDMFLSTCRTRSGNLFLISWRLNPNGSFTRLHDSGTAAGAVSEISITNLRNSRYTHQLATTVKAADGRLMVIIWHISLRTGKIKRRGDSGRNIGVGSRICSTLTQDGLLAISCKTQGTNGHLRIITFSVSMNGIDITRLSDSGSQAGRIGRNSLITRPYGVISAVSTARGTLKLIKWSIDKSGTVRRFGDSADQAGGIGLLAMSETGQKDAPIVTPLETRSNTMDVLSWDDLSSTGELQR